MSLGISLNRPPTTSWNRSAHGVQVQTMRRLFISNKCLCCGGRPAPQNSHFSWSERRSRNRRNVLTRPCACPSSAWVNPGGVGLSVTARPLLLMVIPKNYQSNYTFRLRNPGTTVFALSKPNRTARIKIYFTRNQDVRDCVEAPPNGYLRRRVGKAYEGESSFLLGYPSYRVEPCTDRPATY